MFSFSQQGGEKKPPKEKVIVPLIAKPQPKASCK